MTIPVIRSAVNWASIQSLARKQNQDGRVTFVVEVGLEDLVDRDLEGLNEILDEAVVLDYTWQPTDIFYRVVGCVGDRTDAVLSGSVLLEVNCLPEKAEE